MVEALARYGRCLGLAYVRGVDLPSLADWDLVWSERESLMKRLMAWQQASTPEELYWRHVEGPFQFCHQALGSRVRRCLSRLYDLTPARTGVDCFDLVFLGDVLGHLFSPLHALNVLAPLGWLLMSGFYFGKILPILMRRYTLTNRRLMIRKGWSGKPDI